MERKQGVGRLRVPHLLAELFQSLARAQITAQRAVEPRPMARGTRAATLACVVVVLALPAAAQVPIKCGAWNRLSEDQKFQAIDRTIEDLVSGSRGREYTSINRTQTRRCLESYRGEMVDDFNELCSRGMQTGHDDLNKTFRMYVWSCAQ